MAMAMATKGVISLEIESDQRGRALAHRDISIISKSIN